MASPLISVVVLAYNQFERTTLPCLNSLLPWLGDPEIEFIVYDNASPDGSGNKTQAWCQQHPTVQFIQSPSNLGYAGGMNAAASHAKGLWLFLVNNDTEFAPHALDALKQVLKSAPANMAMIGPVTNAAGNGQRLYDPRKTKEEWLELGAWLNTHPTGLLLPTYRCDFFCIAIRRNAWDQLNGLDTIFGMGYFEDFDFSLRLREAGFDQAITEDVFIYHQGSATFKQSGQIRQLMKTNKKIMRKRHNGIKFEHVRSCNLALLQYKFKASKLLSPSTDHASDPRQALRVMCLHLDLPKSLLKRTLWRIKTSRLLKRIKA
jgi:GT2 family glycosyltransferase